MSPSLLLFVGTRIVEIDRARNGASARRDLAANGEISS
jgi:hypothetical protein